MSFSHPALNAPPPPDWQGLLAVGLDRLRDIRAYGWYFAVTIGLSVLTGVLSQRGVLGSIVSLALGLVGLYAWLVLARQFMTGRLAPEPFDVPNTARLCGVGMLFLFGLGIVAGIIFMLPLSEPLKFRVVVGLTVAAFAAFVIRTAFYVPALALGDPTSVGRSLGQSGPYWKSLTAVFVIVGGGGVVINLAVERLGLPWVIQSLVEGFVGAFGTIPTLAAVCFLYWRHVRPSV